MDGNSCVPQCSVGKVSNKQNQTCVACDAYVFNNEACVGTCPDGYYGAVNKTCAACVAPCKTCSSDTVCLSCATGNFLNQHNLCVSTCPSGQYGRATTGHCESCWAYTYNGTNCIDTCPAGYYGNTTSKQCVGCSNGCATCSSNTVCSSCTSGFYFNSLTNTCGNTCPIGYITDSIDNLCQSCGNKYVLHGADCVTACPIGYGVDERTQNKTCSPCAAFCDVCPTHDTCSVCEKGTFMQQGVCVKDC